MEKAQKIEKYEKIASNSFDGLVHTEDGKLKFPDGNTVSGANKGVFAQKEDSAIEASKKEAEEYIAKKADDVKKAEKAEVQKAENERWEKADRFTGTIHDKDGGRTFAVEGTKVGGVNMHAQIPNSQEAKSFNQMSGDQQVESVLGGNDLIQKAKGDGLKLEEKKLQEEALAKAKKEDEELKK